MCQGGMIAKGMFLEPDFPAHAVKLLVTLATPHTPVILTDPLLRDYYARVSPDWAAGSNMTVISLGGGVRDLVVRSGLTLTDQADISALVSTGGESICCFLSLLFSFICTFCLCNAYTINFVCN